MNIDYFGRMLVIHVFCGQKRSHAYYGILTPDRSPDLIDDETDIQTPAARGAAKQEA